MSSMAIKVALRYILALFITILASTVASFAYYNFWGEYFQNEKTGTVTLILVYISLCGVVLLIAGCYRPKKVDDFSKVTDLIRGTVFAPLDELHQAYEYFILAPGLRIISLKDDLED